ncbi:MAG: response regulator [Anaerolineae bacterium]
MANRIRVLIVDDHPLVREGLQAVIAQAADLEVAGEAASGAEAVRQAAALRPDVILMDLLMPGMDGDQAIIEILAADAARRILVLTSVDDAPRILATVRAGAAGYVSKSAPAAELLEAIRTVHRGSVVLPATIAQALLSGPSALATPPALPDVLTEREVEVLALVAQGLNNDDMARRLGISPRTVSVHVSRILAKLALENRTQAALYALRQGWVTLT